MSNKKTGKISTLGSQLTSIISVSLVLLIVGILCALGLTTRRVADTVLGNVSVIVKMDVTASDNDISAMNGILSSAKYVSETRFTSAEQVLAQEMEYNSEILELLGENPYSAEYEVFLQPAYAHPDSIANITNELMLYSSVDEVVSQVDLLSSIRSVAQKATLVLGCVALVLLIISLVLIYNTVSIAVYARRFVIRTMQLVGATAGFIRRPFVLSGLLWGAVSGLISSALLSACRAYVVSVNPELKPLVGWGDIAMICGLLLGVGMLICGIAAYTATTRYLRASNEDLYAA